MMDFWIFFLQGPKLKRGIFAGTSQIFKPIFLKLNFDIYNYILMKNQWCIFLSNIVHAYKFYYKLFFKHILTWISEILYINLSASHRNATMYPDIIVSQGSNIFWSSDTSIIGMNEAAIANTWHDIKDRLFQGCFMRLTYKINVDI